MILKESCRREQSCDPINATLSSVACPPPQLRQTPRSTSRPLEKSGQKAENKQRYRNDCWSRNELVNLGVRIMELHPLDDSADIEKAPRV